VKQLKLGIANYIRSMRQTTLDDATQGSVVLPRNDGRVYRMNPGGDRWACEMCRLTGDRFFLQDNLEKCQEEEIIDRMSISEYELEWPI
jgi:hypothetical protein